MPSRASDRLGPWIGSAALHLLLIGLLAGLAVHWRTEPPPPQLAIQGNVVRYEDLPSSVKSGRPLREKVPQPPPVAAQREPEPVTEPKPAPVPDPAVEQKLAAEQQAQIAAQRERAEQQRAADAARKEVAQQEAARKEAAQKEAAKQEAATKEAASKDAAKQQEAVQAQRRQQQEQAQAAQQAKLKAESEAKARTEREAELKRALASEEEGEAIQRSGVVDEYRTLLTQTIERNWNKPPSARAGLECTLDVTQLAGGVVTDVKVGACNGDQAVRDSIVNAVYKSSPLPAPRDPRAFARKLVIVFKPTE
jgi:colicin import membrane protein